MLTVEWIDPPMAAGNWLPELLAATGGHELFGQAGQHFPLATALTGRPGWSELRAVREGRTAQVDGHRFFDRPGPRLVGSSQILAEIFHPESFAPDHRGDAWEPRPRV